MTLPSVPDDADEDIPPESEGATRRAPKDPEGDHRRVLDKSKLKFAFWLIATCVGASVVLSLVQYAWPSENSSLVAAIDMLKLLATTALGFVFGRTLGKGEG